ncbi:acidic repeat-containing protein isoform X2 [Cyclopterus lumpus]|uniref:acidic repeat-containing protein isoform X2 n=1 Tax=Cyclopterus lumpus TaxID=8103 RepID=UPI001486CE37|nr:acidic repeat-containing protein isoform X2 [Cyclopterus lumpus]
MNDETRSLFERVSQKMGWDGEGGLDTAERELMSLIGKTRHNATRGHRSVDHSASPVQLSLSDCENNPPKENQYSKTSNYRSKPLIESSDDDFDEFLQRVKTPIVKKISASGSEDSLTKFIVDDSSDDDFIKTSTLKVPKKSNTPASHHPLRRPLSQCDSPVFVSDSDDDYNVVVKSTWRTRHSKPKTQSKVNKNDAPRCDEEDRSPSLPFSSIHSPFSFLPHKTLTSLASPKRTLSAPSKLHESDSSEEEFTSLLERLKNKNKFTGTTFSPKSTHVPPVKGVLTPASKPFGETPLSVKTPGKSTTLKPTVSQTEPRPGPTSRLPLCKTPGCFLQSLSNTGSSCGRNFKQNKEALTIRLYQLYNTSVFDNKLPTNMSVTWNKKMRKTAGYCITGQERCGGNRYARIELSEKVCDSADRLRDTLIHEMCHAATWLINAVRDGHGNFWKLYARKSTLAHPELPMVTRCHSYDIKYKFQYQCTRCQNLIGRHSKSLDTQRFMCALCNGQLVLLTAAKPRAPTPFANFVKENYGTVRQELSGQSHGEVMRKLSVDFASKTKLSQS